jgi:hypothetical protein
MHMFLSYVMLRNSAAVTVTQATQGPGAADRAELARDLAQAQREVAQAQREAAQSQREAARDAAQAQREATQAQREAEQAQRESQQGNGDGNNVGTVTITLENGKIITLEGASPEAVATALGIPYRNDRPESDGPFVVGGLAIVASAVVFIVGLTLRYRAKMRSIASPAALPSDLAQRMARMENGIESVAVEVERISEGQRFTTRLLSDRAPLEVPRG